MPSIRRITLSRRRQSTLNRLTVDEFNFEEGGRQQCDNDGNNSPSVDSDGETGTQPEDKKVMESPLSNELMLVVNEHQSNLTVSPNNRCDVGNANQEQKRKVSFRLQSISDMSDVFMENMNHAVEQSPVKELNSFRKQVGHIVNGSKVQAFILSLIVVNAIMMGVATFPLVKENTNVSSIFELIDQILLIIFTIESAMQLTYHGWTLFKDAWLVFDLTIVALSWALVGMKVFRAFRIFRALRLVGRVDVMRNLISAVISVIPGLTGILMLLLLVFYIFAVMFTQLYKDVSNEYPQQQQYFVELPETFFSLFQMMTLDSWKNMYTQAHDEYWWSWVLFISFIVITAFVVANLIIAVICDAVHVLGDHDAAGLIGYEGDDAAKERAKFRRNFELSERLNSTTINRLKEMEIQLDQILLMRSKLTVSIDLLVRRSQNFTGSEGPTEREHEGELTQCYERDYNIAGTDISEEDLESDMCSNEDRPVNHPTISNGCNHLYQPQNGSPLVYEDYQRKLNNQTLSAISDRYMKIVSDVIERPPFSQLNDARKKMGKIVNDNKVQAFILALIVINAIMMGMATFPLVKENPSISSKFELIDQIFLVIFTIESAMQLAYHGWTLFKDAWLVFDLSIVALSWALDGVKVARAFRIFRALRLIGRIDVMKNLIIAVMSVIPGLTGIWMLLLLVFYIFAVMFTQLYKDVSKQYPRQQQYFVGLPETLFTLFQMMTLDGWTKIFSQAYNEYWWSWILFVAFIVVTAFVFVNLIIAVICDAVHVMSDKEVAGLTGLDEDDVTKARSRDPLLGSPRSTDSASRPKLRELERSIDEIVSIQNQMVGIIDKVARSSCT